jgi:malate synthase
MITTAPAICGCRKDGNSVSDLRIRDAVQSAYGDVLTRAAVDALHALQPFERSRQDVMAARLARRAARARDRQRIRFLDPADTVPGTAITVADARAGRFEGGSIPRDLERQWIQGTGPAAKPNSTVPKSIRNIAYALLSGADGWMFDGEDALGQIGTMSLDNQRNLKLAIHRSPEFMTAVEQVAAEMNAWSDGFFGRRIVEDWRSQLGFTTKIFRPRGLHLDDRHVRQADGGGFSASIVDTVLFVVSNQQRLRDDGASLVLYLPKIQTADEAALWHALLGALERHIGIPGDAIRTYVLVEQVEASFQLMEIRAALGRRFVGFNTGRWDYINSVADAMAWDAGFVNPNIDAITMTYGYMRAYEDRVRRSVNTPDANGRFALWQGGMEPNIPVGSPAGVDAAMKRAVAGAEREQLAGASGKWVAHWKMVHIVRPVWERVGESNQLGRKFPPLSYTDADADGLLMLEPAPRTVRGARDLLSVGLQYSNAFGQGMQAAALKPADFFGDDDVLYLMEDMATAEIRLSILWEWLHKGATLEREGAAMEREGAAMEREGFSRATERERFSPALFDRLLAEEYDKLLRADNRDVHDDSKLTTLPIARAIVERYVKEPAKLPWFVDLLNLTLDTYDMDEASNRIERLAAEFRTRGVRLTSLV